MSGDPSDLGELLQTEFGKSPNGKEVFRLDLVVGMEVGIRRTSSFPHGPHASTPYHLHGHRDDFLRMARTILAELERTSDQIHETLLRIESFRRRMFSRRGNGGLGCSFSSSCEKYFMKCSAGLAWSVCEASSRNSSTAS